jgi:tRNA pseudouridine38-40 synthase|tara:strand:+ start:12892 stop:13629 length:738 start_codon:yes stop_codon:yes gene_type:complete
LRRFKITIQYDGSSFSGWQLQKNLRTVQGEVEDALKIISGSKFRIPVHGSGRTDAGVHAYGQVAHFDIDTKLDPIKLCDAINANTTKDCKIMSALEVNSKFESRFSAKKRWYRYQVYRGSSILYSNQAWLIDNVDLKVLNSLSKFILGEHDFLSFSKYRADQKNTISEIYHSNWEEKDNMFIYEISGNRFLHHMVRYLVGTMIQVARNQFSMEQFRTLLNKPRKKVQIHRAPACGLILLKVEYGK